MQPEPYGGQNTLGMGCCHAGRQLGSEAAPTAQPLLHFWVLGMSVSPSAPGPCALVNVHMGHQLSPRWVGPLFPPLVIPRNPHQPPTAPDTPCFLLHLDPALSPLSHPHSSPASTRAHREGTGARTLGFSAGGNAGCQPTASCASAPKPMTETPLTSRNVGLVLMGNSDFLMRKRLWAAS